MTITLNIGLNISKQYMPDGVEEMTLKYKYEYVKDYLYRAFGTPIWIGVVQSTTEQTVVVQYKRVESVLYKLALLAHELQQDCIAYAIQADDGTDVGGALVGKYAHEWNFGIFNEDYFIPISAAYA